ncbi:MAG: peptidylprolyl isomerase [Trueperaceae bacterium]|nr:peptidylprolyl isomerase [Trueperaceae bacterium]
MSRLQSLAIAAVALVTLALGIAWWNGSGADDGAANDAPAADASADVAAQGENGAATQAESADAPPSSEPAAPADVAVPDGYAAVAPLVAERQVAFEAADEVLDPALDYAAVIETNRGTLVVDLFEAETPVTVNNFVFLALHRYYDSIVFHRVIDGFMAQTGDPTGTGTGGPGYRFADEFVEGLVHDAPGVLSMANAGPGTNGSQFFLTFDATPWLDGAHTVFGRVVDGLDVLDAMTRVDPQQPSVVALLSDPVADVRAQGIDLAGDGTVEAALTEALGAAPVPGPGFEIAGARVAIGSVDGAPAAGFFPFPDRMERVTIVARSRD